ncbi:DUF2235 domain-containing protein [Pseudahrensia aquimaris]|uniref:DUF2235 domain-containing protein n=1 Tax=Pseudahrensia aquimaris TaxID=744461 RepID=A0ABW3FEQ1_9HYPH
MSKKARGDHHAGKTPPKAPKRIFLFSDGTGNAASTLTKTNVWRMYQALEKSGEGEPIQVALYDNGVGTSSFRPLTIIAGIFGFGLKQNVLDLYRFLCLQYEEGAEIYLIGFSRGAFTMRLLASMVALNGILKLGRAEGGIDPTQIDRAGNIAFQRLSDLFPARNPLLHPLRWLRNRFTRKSFGEDKTHFDDLARHTSRDITFMGLFETVSAYGGPVQEFTDAFSWLFFPTEPEDWTVGPHVRQVCHALALDEPRHSFWPKLVNEAKDPNWNDPHTVPELEPGDRIEQVWFAGAHAHVGGGYANDGLSMVPLNWMFDKLRFGHNIRFDESALDQFKAAEDVCAPLADPRDGAGFVYRYNPRNLSRMTEDPRNNIYTAKPKIHHSVFDRMKQNPDYAPIAINRDYEIVDKWKAKDHHAVYDRKADFHLNESEWTPQDTQGRAFVPDANPMNPLFTAKRFNAHVEAAWDDVWLRRILFAVQMILMFALIASPWLLGAEKNSACESPLCFLREPIRTLASLLPGPAQPWADVFSANPTIITLGLIAFAGTIVTGRRIRHGINATLIGYWHYLVGRTDTKPPEPEKSWIYTLRNSAWYRFFFHKLKHNLMTVFFGLVILNILIVGINQGVLYVRDRSSPQLAVCNPPIPQTKEPITFNNRQVCIDTGVDVVLGGQYRVTLTPKVETGNTARFPWKDGYAAAGPNGLEDTFYAFAAKVFSISIKRHPTRALGVPAVTIGQRFPTLQKVTDFELSEDGSEWSATFTSTAEGRAYMTINNAVISPLPARWQFFYANNQGGGNVRIAEFFGPVF